MNYHFSSNIYSASLRKTNCVIHEEFEAGNERNMFCGGVMKSVKEFTVERFKLSSLNLIQFSRLNIDCLLKKNLRLVSQFSWS